MSLANELLKELKQEAAVTRRYLENVPFDKLDYKPAAKSETLGRLAIHLAEIVAWWTECINKSELDFIDFEPQDIRSGEELLSFFDCLLSEAERALSTATNSDLEEPWSMMHGETVYFTLPKKQVLRVFLYESFGASPGAVRCIFKDFRYRFTGYLWPLG